MVTVPLSDSASLLQQEAQERGFLVSWSPISLPDWVQTRYQQWIKAKHQATMGHLSRAISIRLAPQERLAWANSAMILAAPHAFPAMSPPPNGLRLGRVGRVFWVREQEFIQPLFESHLEDLKDMAYKLGGRCQDYVDQGPLSFRSYAAMSGLGWIGYNGMILNPAVGSYLTLAVLLTSFELPHSVSPHANQCGSCRLCVQQCPTNALLGQGDLDANRCISYWTTQHRDMIPAEKWASIGNWLYGCDICQQVCPWNKKAETFWAAYQPEANLAHPDLRDFLTLSEGAFRAKYDQTAFERNGRSRMARNALIVLSNTQDSAHLPLIRQAAQDSSPLVRATATQALVNLNDRHTAEKSLKDSNPMVQQAARLALDASA